MRKWNVHKTAYCSGGIWYLLPRGRVRPPLIDHSAADRALWSYMTENLKEECIQLITEKDRELLLSALDEGCFGLVWYEMKRVLTDRREKNYELLMVSNGHKLKARENY